MLACLLVRSRSLSNANAVENKKTEEASTEASTICDYHNFGLIFAGIMHCLPQRLKSTLWVPFGHPPFEKVSNNVDFSL